MATTVNVTFPPAAADCAIGCVVMAGATDPAVTVRLAAELATFPTLFVAIAT